MLSRDAETWPLLFAGRLILPVLALAGAVIALTRHDAGSFCAGAAMAAGAAFTAGWRVPMRWREPRGAKKNAGPWAPLASVVAACSAFLLAVLSERSATVEGSIVIEHDRPAVHPGRAELPGLPAPPAGQGDTAAAPPDVVRAGPAHAPEGWTDVEPTPRSRRPKPRPESRSRAAAIKAHDLPEVPAVARPMAHEAAESCREIAGQQSDGGTGAITECVGRSGRLSSDEF